MAAAPPRARCHLPSALERLRFALLRDGPKLPGGRYVGMETAPIRPWPHQAVVARRLIATWPYSYLLCDEVGLGKTIEAGLAIRSLYLSGLAQRVLICAPASLTHAVAARDGEQVFPALRRALGERPPATPTCSRAQRSARPPQSMHPTSPSFPLVWLSAA